MNILLRTALVIAASGLPVVQNAIGAETYVIDASHTSVIFGVSHLGYSYTYGRFNKAKGGYVLDRENPNASQIQFAIDAASLDTNDQKRDEHLTGPDFFNVKQFPVISFQSTAVAVEKTAKGDIYNVTGNLTIHGVTKKVTLPLQKMGEGKGPAGNFRTGFHYQGSLKRSDFGMTNMIPMIGDEVAVTVSFEGIRQKASQSAGSGRKP
jgi:polyisoprenoid-binding protein YceI